MEATKQKKTFKETMKDVGQKAKSYAKKQTDKVKTSAKNYASDIRTAYEIGYNQGWNDANTVPNRVGAKTAATYGYKKGLTNRRKSDKYNKPIVGNEKNHNGENRRLPSEDKANVKSKKKKKR